MEIDNDFCAFGRETNRDRLADAAASARYDCNFVI